MDESKKLDNVVKIFIESLRESKEFNESTVSTVARSITNELASMYDPSKKEFRDKVNVLKMKLKGSRNAPIRNALLKGHF